MSKHYGFTLIELMVTVAVAAILVTVAVPAFQSIFLSNRLTTTTNDLVTALTLARSEAIRRGTAVSACAGGSNGWKEGIAVTLGDCTGTVLRVAEPLNQSLTLATSPSSTTITFDGLGEVTAPKNPPSSSSNPNGDLIFQLSGGGQSRLIYINSVGRIRSCQPEPGQPCSPT